MIAYRRVSTSGRSAAQERQFVFGRLDGAPGLDHSRFEADFDKIEFVPAVNLSAEVPVLGGFVPRCIIGADDKYIRPVRFFEPVEAFVTRDQLSGIVLDLQNTAG